jgi:hypothetical protein
MGGRNGIYIQGFEPEENRPLGRSRHRWYDTITMDIEDIGWGGMDWSNLSQDAMVGSYEHDNEPLGSKQYGDFLIN